jgi:hypothetical protein
MINESFNKKLKETFTGYKLKSLVYTLKHTLSAVCKYYSDNKKYFAIYPNQNIHKKEIVTKSNELTKQQFTRLDINKIRFDAFSKFSSEFYRHFIRIYNPLS